MNEILVSQITCTKLNVLLCVRDALIRPR